jgi:threonine aldolase
MKIIDLRSDTVTKPGDEMRKVMAAAEVGDDVYGEDPTVNRLEALAAGVCGMEDALFAPSGTMSNLLALLSHCERGDEYIVGQQGHTYKYEGGGAAVFGSIQPQPLDYEEDGTLDLLKVESAIKPHSDFHFAKTRLLCLENTQAGKVLSADYLTSAVNFVRRQGLKLHLDGARIFNAVVRLGMSAAQLVAGFDSVSICLSKGLGAPVGSLVCGSRELIGRARRWRKVLGGGMRQSGILAAAGIYALEHNIARLAEDHAHAAALAEGLALVDEVTVLPGSAQTNMVFIQISPDKTGPFQTYMKENGILLSGRDSYRLVTHLDVDAGDIKRVVETAAAFFGL